jgi:hypothetical protein
VKETPVTKFLARTHVVLTALPTYLVAIATVLPLVAADLAEVMPGQAETITTAAIVVVGWLGAAVSIIRRVTPVASARRGLLDERGAVTITELALGVIAAVAVLWAVGAVPR